MVNEPDESHPDPVEEDDGGGPVKSFLEHLEDLRWTLIKSAASVALGMFICLIGGNTLMAIIKWPLERSSINQPPPNSASLNIFLGTNLVGTFHIPTNEISVSPDLGPYVAIQLKLATNQSVEWQVLTNSAAANRHRSVVQLLNLSPAGGFFVAFQIAFYGGVVLAAPFILYFVGQFVVPAMKAKERQFVFRGLSVGLVLFFAGVAFCYFFLMPLALAASVKYSEWLGIAAFQWRAEEYISFVCKFMLGMGLGFELPVVILMLVRLGILTADQLAKFRAYMVVINLVLGAVLTTPEVLTQLMMFVPLQALYEISILIARYWERKERKRQKDLGLSD